MSKKGQFASGKSRMTAKQSSDRSFHEPRSSRVQSTSNDRRSIGSRSRRNESSDSFESLHCSHNRPRHAPLRSRRDGISQTIVMEIVRTTIVEIEIAEGVAIIDAIGQGEDKTLRPMMMIRTMAVMNRVMIVRQTITN